MNNVQYDTQSSVVGWQSRFRWILKPGNDLYVVYTHNWMDDPLQNRIYTLDRRTASKFMYTYQLGSSNAGTGSVARSVLHCAVGSCHVLCYLLV